MGTSGYVIEILQRQTNDKKKWDKHCELFISYVATCQQHLHMELSVYISQLKRYSRACGSYQDFLDRMLLLTRKLLNQVITSKVLRSPPWLGWPLWNICVTNDHGYVPLVVNTSRYFSHSWLVARFVTRLTRRGCH